MVVLELWFVEMLPFWCTSAQKAPRVLNVEKYLLKREKDFNPYSHLKSCVSGGDEKALKFTRLGRSLCAGRIKGFLMGLLPYLELGLGLHPAGAGIALGIGKKIIAK